MGVLDDLNVTKTPAELAAESAKVQARATFKQLVSTFNRTSLTFWKNPRATPAEIAAALGTDAAEVFALHGQIGALLGAVDPAAIAPGLAVVGDYEVHEDGSITIPEPPEESSEAL